MPSANVDTRLTRGITSCAADMKPRLAPAPWNVTATSPKTLLDVEITADACVRIAVAITEPGHLARIDAVDAEGRVLATASGSTFVLVPADGPLCVPAGTTLRATLLANRVPLTGVAVLLESP